MKTTRQTAFALPELLSILAIAAVLALLAPALAANNRHATTALQCLANMRQLVGAWHSYAIEHNENLVENFHGGDAQSGSIATNPNRRPWALGWVTWGIEPDNTNTLFIRNERYAKLAPYISATNNIHKCPADNYLSAAQRARGWKERVRSVVMNGTLGHVNSASNPGPWDPIYNAALKLSALQFPSPSETMVFLEEHPDSINDPFFFPPLRASWVDLPGALHEGAGSFSFADGHAEIHPWRGPIGRVAVGSRPVSTVRLPDADLSWMSYHSQRRTEQSF